MTAVAWGLLVLVIAALLALVWALLAIADDSDARAREAWAKFADGRWQDGRWRE